VITLLRNVRRFQSGFVAAGGSVKVQCLRADGPLFEVITERPGAAVYAFSDAIIARPISQGTGSVTRERYAEAKARERACLPSFVDEPVAESLNAACGRLLDWIFGINPLETSRHPRD